MVVLPGDRAIPTITATKSSSTSCYHSVSAAQGYTATNCQGAPRVVMTSTNNLLLDADFSTADTQSFCRVVAPAQVSGDAYDVSIVMDSQVLSVPSTNYGTPGVIYNVQDEDNFDFVFFRCDAFGVVQCKTTITMTLCNSY